MVCWCKKILFYGFLVLFAGLSLSAQTISEMEYNATNSEFEYFNGSSWIGTDNGDTAVGCSTVGSMQYNSTDDRLEFCEGSTWHSMMGANSATACSSPGELNFNTTDNLYQVCSGATNTLWYIFDAANSITIDDIIAYEGSDLIFTVSLGQPAILAMEIDWSTADNTASSGTDYTGASGTLTIPSGSSSGTITVSSIDVASTCDDDKDFFLNLTGTNYGTLTDTQGVGTIRESDFPEVNIASDSETEGTTQDFNVTLSFACPTKAMGFDYFTVDITATEGLDYTATSGSISIPAGSTTDSFSVTVLSDSLPEMNETFAIAANNFSNTIVSSTGFPRGTIIDDDVSGEQTLKVAAGRWRTCALSSAGKVKCWGMFNRPFYDQNRAGFSAEGDVIGNDPHETWNNIPFLDMGTSDGSTPHTIKQATVSGGNTGCAILDDDRLKCWGFPTGYGGVYGNDGNFYGYKNGSMGDNLPYIDLGTNGATPHTAKQVVSWSYTEAICVVLDDNRLKCFGTSDGSMPAILGLESSTNSRGDFAGEMGDNLPYVNLGTSDGSTPHTVTKIAMAAANACAILDDGRVKCWGNESGYGYGDTLRRGDDPGEMGDNLGYVNLGTSDGSTPHTAKDIEAGGEHFCVILDDDRVKCWGRNYNGQLGLGDTNDRGDDAGELGDTLGYVDLGTSDGSTPHTAKSLSSNASEETCAILDDNRVKCWGRSWSGSYFALGADYGAIGDEPGEMGDNLRYSLIGTGRTAKKIRLKGYVTDSLMVIRDNDTVVVYGENEMGDLGLGSDERSFGWNAGTSGDNSRVLDLGGLTPVDFADGGSGTNNCIIFSNGKMKCAGGASGSIGIVGDLNVGDEANEIGGLLEDIELPPGRTAIDIHFTMEDLCILLDDYTNHCAGSARGYQNGYQGEPRTLGLLNGADQISYENHYADACMLDEYFNFYCWRMGAEDPSALSPLDFGTNLKVIDFSVGTYHTCVILNDSSLRCWGSGDNGRLGNESWSGIPDPAPGSPPPPVDLGTVSTPIKVQVTDANTCVLFANKQVKCFGYSNYLNSSFSDNIGSSSGDMGDNLPFINFGGARSVKKLFSGTFFDMCVRLDNDDLTCWGENGVGWWDYEQWGQLGYGNTNRVQAPNGSYTAVDLNGDLVEDLTMSNSHTCALTDSNDIKCWGNNDYGQLGQGDTVTRGDDASEMGSNLSAVDMNWTADTSMKRIFVTNGTFDGTFNSNPGLAGADSVCQAAADAQTLGGTWKALLSDSTTDAVSRINLPANEVQLIDGTVIAKGWNDLKDGMIANRVQVDETGSNIGAVSVTTGSNSDFTKATAISDELCDDWTTNSPAGSKSRVVGNSNSVAEPWLNNATAACNLSLRLYCMEQ